MVFDDDLLVVAEEVEEALFEGQPVVALETTLLAHGFPHPEGVAVARAAEDAVRQGGAIPATIAVLDGAVHVGIDAPTLDRLGDGASHVAKCGPRDIAACVAEGGLGATTVGGTITICRSAGISVMATGGIGGVHRGFPNPPDVSADLAALARIEVLVVCAGIKSVLDVVSTSELLETSGVPVIGWQTDTLPMFFAREGGPPVSARADTVDRVADIARAHWNLGGAGVLLGRPPDSSLEGAEDLVDQALDAASRQGITGQAVTPFLLAFLHDRSEGRTLTLNRDLIVGNARLSGECAVALGDRDADADLFDEDLVEDLDEDGALPEDA